MAAVLLVAATGALTACSGSDESLSGARKRLLQDDFDRADQDDDGHVNGDERAAQVQTDFFAMEITGDGVVTMADVHADAQRHGRRPSGRLSDHLGFDGNGDERVEPGEYEQDVTTWFAPMDADGDGSYSWDEVRTFHEDLGSGRRRPTTTTAGSASSDPVAATFFAAAGVSLLVAVRTRERRRLALHGGITVVTAVAVLHLLAGAAPARASAVYNDTERRWDVVFTCGVFCAEVWTDVGAGASRSRPGQGGQYQMGAGDGGDRSELAVPDHGWSSLVADAGTSRIAWSSYDNDGNLIRRVFIEPSGP